MLAEIVCWSLAAGAATVAAVLWTHQDPAGPRPPDRVLEAIRVNVLETTAALHDLEAQRFVPPVAGAVLDRYTMELQADVDRLEYIVRGWLAMALYDLARARTAAEWNRAATFARSALRDARNVARRVAVDEWNERQYIDQLLGWFSLIESAVGVP